LRWWQRKEICRIYDNPHGTRTAILSFGRKNGKTALVAFLLLLHLCGPEAKVNSQLYSAAQSQDQAAIVYKLAAKIVRLSPTLNSFVICRDTIKELACAELGTLYKALSAEASTAYGLSPVFIVHDELGQVKGPTSELYEALETATGAQDNPLSIVISTQAPTDGDLLSILIDRAQQENPPHVILSLYTADAALDPFSDEAIIQANPAFGDFQNADVVRQMAEDAKAMPSKESSYRNLILNQRVDVNAPFVSRVTWDKCGGPVIDSFKGLPVYCGLDLSEVSDLTAFVAVAPVDEAWHVKPTFWLPGKGIVEKSRLDRVPYDLWAKEGHLQLTPGPTVDYEFVAEFLRGFFDAHDVRMVAFDDWNWRHLKPWLLKAGFPESWLAPTEPAPGAERGAEMRFQPFRQGFKTMSPALRDLEAALLTEKIVHGKHPVLSMCAANATVQSDPAGNRKFTKAKSHGRIDGMVALVMAMSVAGTYQPAAPAPEYQMFFV
jgi:phage terminase large subunit-like protein